MHVCNMLTHTLLKLLHGEAAVLDKVLGAQYVLEVGDEVHKVGAVHADVLLNATLQHD